MALTKVTGGTISTTSNYEVGVITATKFVGPFEGSVTGVATGSSKVITSTESSDTTCFPLFVNSSTDAYQAPKLGSNLTFNSSTGDLGATKVTAEQFVGNISGTGATFTTLDVSGTLNYTHVTDVYSVGVATFQNNVQAGAGISVVGVSTFTNGVGIADSIFHTGDTNTAIKFDTDTIKLETGGSERLRAVNDGVVITGVTTVSASAHISNANGSVFFGAGNDTAYGSQGGIGRASQHDYHIGNSEPGDLCIAAEGSKRILFGTKTGTGIGGIDLKMLIASGGQIAIGTTIEGHGSADNLTIADSGNGGITIRTGGTSNGAIFFSDHTTGTGEYDGFVQYNHGPDPYMLFGTSSDERLRIRGDGNINAQKSLAVGGITTSAGYDLSAINITSGLESPYDATGTGETIFVYDTRNDADGGAWRKKCRHTSWYNEPSGTYRGTRKEFPAVAVIVLGQVRTTIYDADDPTMPLWMQFRSTAQGYMLGCNDDYPSCVTALNGVIYIGAKNVYGGFHIIDFIKDTAKRVRAAVTSNGTHGWWPTGIAGRNGTDDSGGLWNTDGRGYDSTDLGSLKSDDVWSVAVKALKGAPIDPITNLPIPTIAVAVDAGISIIKPEWHLGLNRSNTPSYHVNDVSGHIIDINSDNGSYTQGYSLAWTDNDDLIFVMGDGNGDYAYIHTMDGHAKWDNSITIDSKTANNNHHIRSLWRGRPSSSSIYSNLLSIGSDWSVSHNTHQHKVNQVVAKKGYEFAASTRNGLNHIYENPEGDNSMVAYATTSHTTGWMVGKEKMCVMASTDTTNLSGTDLAPNNCATTGPGRTEANSTTGWTNAGMATFESSNTRAFDGSYSLHLTANSNGDACYFGFTTVVGKKYTVSARLWVTHDSFTIKLGTSHTDGNQYFESPPIGTVAQWQMFTGSFQATTTTTYFNVTESSTSQDTDGYIDNVIITEADPDHTNTHGFAGAGAMQKGVNRGLQVYGTISKTPVATGAEICSYSGWSSDNYLYQAYNPNLNHGSGDFAFYWWMNPHDSSSGSAIWSLADNKTMTASNASSYIRVYFNGDDLRYDLSTNGQSYDTGQKGLRMHAQDLKSWMLCHLIRRGNTMEIWINGRRELVKQMQTFLWGQSLFTAYSELRIGHDSSTGTADPDIEMALFRSSRSAPNEHQIKKMYKDELALFQENAKCTLVGTTNDRIEAMAYDKRSDILYVGGKGGRADFSGLVRINNNTTEVTRGMSASNDLVVEY